MKLSITHAEAVKLIREHFRLNSDVDVYIGRKTSSAQKKLKQSEPAPNTVPAFLLGVSAKTCGFDSVRNTWEYITSFLPHNKIGAIKELRHQTGYDLRSAKDAVENWDIFAPIVFRKNTWPIARFVSHDSMTNFS